MVRRGRPQSVLPAGWWSLSGSGDIVTGLKGYLAALAILAAFPVLSDDSWTVEVEGRTVRLERQETLTHPKDAPPYVDERKGGWYQYGRFTLRKPVEVRVRSTRSLAALKVSPAKYGVEPRRISDREVAVDITRPCHLSFECDGRKGALHLFADEPMAPPPQSPDVIYFGPGEHVLDPVELNLRSGQTLFLDEGAVLHGRVSASGENIGILGPGVISGSRFRRFEGPRGLGFLWIHNATNVTVRGVAIAAPNRWSVVAKECDRVLFDDVRVLGANMINDDGIDLVNSRNVTIRRSFIRTQDDNICMKGICHPARPEDGPPVENIRIEDCELWCDGANTFRFGFECDAPYMKEVAVRDVDVLHFSPLPNPPISHIWSHAVFKIQTSDGMVFSGLDAKGVRINADGNDVNLVIAESRPMRVPRESWVNGHKYARGGAIRDCRFEDISVHGEKDGFIGGIHLIGRTPEENVTGMHFSGIDYFGEAISGTSECVHVGPYAEAEFETR